MLLARIDLRNHRKIVVIDGAIGYCGSTNIADAAFAIKPKFAPWVDASVRIHGPVAWDLQMLFVEDWFLGTEESLDEMLHYQPLAQPDGVPGQLIGTGPSSYNEALRQLIQSAFHMARQELIMTTPYFVPDEATLSALCTAARRGVQTILVLPARNDSPLVAAASRSQYAMLLDAGVEIHEFQRGLLHAKTMTIDRNLAMIGSANLDRRSFELNLEVSLMVYDQDFASQLRFLQRGYMDASRPVDRAAWNRRPWPTQLVQNAAGTLGPLL
jgi:cardiolipin synthase